MVFSGGCARVGASHCCAARCGCAARGVVFCLSFGLAFVGSRPAVGCFVLRGSGGLVARCRWSAAMDPAAGETGACEYEPSGGLA